MTKHPIEKSVKPAALVQATAIQTEAAAIEAALAALVDSTQPAQADVSVLVAALDPRVQEVTPDTETVVSDASPLPTEPVATFSEPVLLAQASSNNSATAAAPAGGEKKDDQAAAATNSDDENSGLLWGGLGLAALAGLSGGSSGSSPAPVENPYVPNPTALGITDGTQLQFAAGAYKSSSPGTSTIASALFDNANPDGVNVDIVGEFVFEEYTGTDNQAPAQGHYTLVLGSYDALEDAFTPSAEGGDDVLVVWDVAGNANYGYILEDLAANATFTVEGDAYQFTGTAVIAA